MRSIFLSLVLSCFSFVFAQDFEGVIKFSIEYPEKMVASIPAQLQDSVKTSTKFIKGDQIRTENFTAMGKQVLLERVGSDTSYLMFNLM
ncbi:MAG: hypothetical protein R2799_16210, partial [Crocinitomicaceae bacterium]